MTRSLVCSLLSDPRSHARRVCSSLVLFAALAGCGVFAPGPAFRAELPAAIDAEDTIAVIGDLQMTPWLVRWPRGRENNLEAQRVLVADLHDRAAELGAVALVGDLVFTPRSQRDWTHFDRLVGPLARSVPILPAMGNHDYHCLFVQLCRQRVVPRQTRARFPWLAPGVPYAVASGDLQLLFIDSETALEQQARWLRERLQRPDPQRSMAIVFFHRPPYSSSQDRGAVGNVDVQRWLVPVLRAAPVTTIVINGHVHGYEHQIIDGIHYVTSAGGGGPRGWLAADRPHDVYGGRNCATDSEHAVLRPLNYLLVRRLEGAVRIEVRGLCSGEERVDVLESFTIVQRNGEARGQ